MNRHRRSLTAAGFARAALLLLLSAALGCSSFPDGAGLPMPRFLGSAAPPAWELPPPVPEDRPVVDATRLHRRTLDNGLTVVMLVDRRLPAADFGVIVRRGAAIVPVEEAGLAAFTAELMGRGAGTRTALELAEVVDALGASLGTASSWDSTSVSVGGLSRDEATLFDVLADVVLRPRFDEDEATRVRGEMLAGLERAREDPRTLASWNFAEALYAGHRFGVPSSGRPDTVAALDAGAARRFHGEVFVPSNAIFYAVGDIDPEELGARVEAIYGGWEGAAAPAPGPPPPARTGRDVVIVDRPDLGQAQVVIGHPGIKRTEPRRIPVQAMNTVLGSAGFSSRLMSKIRAEEGLTYTIRSYFAGRRQTGPFIIGTFTRVPEVGRLVSLTLAELERVRVEPPSPAELASAKTLLAGRFGLGLETSTAVVSSLVELDVQGLPEDSLDTYRGRIRALGDEEVAAAARDFVRPDEVAIVVVGPAEALRPQLEAFGPVRVVEP